MGSDHHLQETLSTIQISHLINLLPLFIRQKQNTQKKEQGQFYCLQNMLRLFLLCHVR